MVKIYDNMAKIVLSWREFYRVLMEQNRRIGCDCLIFLYYYDDSINDGFDAIYDGFYLTYESITSRINMIRNLGYKVIPVTTDINNRHIEAIVSFVHRYLDQEIKCIRFRRYCSTDKPYIYDGNDFKVEFEPRCGNIDNINEHFIKVMLETIE